MPCSASCGNIGSSAQIDDKLPPNVSAAKSVNKQGQPTATRRVRFLFGDNLA